MGILQFIEGLLPILLPMLLSVLFLNAMFFGFRFYGEFFVYLPFPIVILFMTVDCFVGMYIYFCIFGAKILEFININPSIIDIFVSIIILVIFLVVPIYLESISEKIFDKKMKKRVEEEEKEEKIKMVDEWLHSN